MTAAGSACGKAWKKKPCRWLRWPRLLNVLICYSNVFDLSNLLKSKSELKDEDYNQFYKEKFFDYDDPIAHIHTKAEGTATYNALMYIPSKAPFDYYSKDYEKGLQLYSNGVLIMDKCPDLLPDYFSFVKGLVDSADLSLNISREMLQHDRQLKIIEKSLERSIKNELTKMLRNEIGRASCRERV